MSDLRTAAKAALWAFQCHVEQTWPTDRSTAAIAALRAALAQQEEPCPNCASLEAQNTELDQKLAELEQAYQSGYNAGVAHEREACARACEHQPHWVACAAAIRARGNT